MTASSELMGADAEGFRRERYNAIRGTDSNSLSDDRNVRAGQ